MTFHGAYEPCIHQHIGHTFLVRFIAYSYRVIADRDRRHVENIRPHSSEARRTYQTPVVRVQVDV